MDDIAVSGSDSQAPEKSSELLPLDLPERVVALSPRKGQLKRHIFRRLVAADWEYFFSHFFSRAGRKAGAGATDDADADYALLQLHRRTILRVEGYGAAGCGDHSENAVDWQESAPRKWRLSAAMALMNLTGSVRNGVERPSSQSQWVRVEALWSQDGEHDWMKQYRGLEHRFSRPSASHIARYDDAKNRGPIAGRITSLEPVIACPASAVVELYDELIERVEGYAVRGRGLAGKNEIVREMDYFHKAFVATTLFEREVGYPKRKN